MRHGDDNYLDVSSNDDDDNEEQRPNWKKMGWKTPEGWRVRRNNINNHWPITLEAKKGKVSAWFVLITANA